MFRNFTILSLVLLFSFSLFAQEIVQSEKVSKNSVHILNNLQASGRQPYIIGGGGRNPHDSPLSTDLLCLEYNGYASTSQICPTRTAKYSRGHYIITAAEMAAAGFPANVNITDLVWDFYSTPSTAATGTLKIYLANTNDASDLLSATWSTAIAGMTLVDNNAAYTTPTSTYKYEYFSNPSAFTYSGGGLYIAYELSFTSSASATRPWSRQDVAGYNRGFFASSSSALPTTVVASVQAAETYVGFTKPNNANVLNVLTIGKLPIPFSKPDTIKAYIENDGSNTLTNLPVTLNITGANTFTSTVTIASLAPDYYTLVTFPVFNPTNAGTDIVTVSVPNDDWNADNSASMEQLVTTNTYTYSYGPFPPTSDGGVGFSTATGDFVAKFYTGTAASISQVVVNFTTAGAGFKIGIWDATGTNGMPGTNLWTSAAQTTTVGVFTLPVSPVVNVSGSFYVGVLQTSTTNVTFGYQVESPIRPWTFVYRTPSLTGTWTDFYPNNPYRFMIEPKLSIANDVGASVMSNPVGGSIHHLNDFPFTPQATVSNYGTSNQGAFNVTMKIYDTNKVSVYTSTKSISSLNSGVSTPVTFDPTSFTPQAETYTAKCYTSLGTDADHTNDTVSAAFDYSYWEFDLGAFFQGFTKSDGTGMNYAPSAVTVELHNSTSPYALVESKTSSVGIGGIGVFNFVTALDSIPYYIVVKSINTVETWSASPQLFSGAYLFYDFTSANSQAFGTNMTQIGSAWCIYSGDVNQDGSVDGLDLGAVDNDNNNFVSGNPVTDLNGDGSTDGLDLGIVDNNNNAFVSKVVPSGAPAIKHVRPQAKTVMTQKH